MGSTDPHMTQSDLFAWSMERDPTLRSTIATVLMLDTEPEWEGLVHVLARGTHVVPRLRHVLSTAPMDLTPPRWMPDPNFDLSWHLRRVALPPPADLAAVLEFARTEIMTAFDPARPLWTFTVLTGLPGGRSAAVLKVHHSLTDGVGGIQIAGEVLDFTREGTKREPVRKPEEATRGTLGDIVTWNWSTGYGLLRGGLTVAASTARQTLTNPVRAVRSGAALALSVGRLARPVITTLSPVMTARGLGRRLAVLEVPLDRLSDSARRVGCTVNDAYLTALLLGLRAYHIRHDAPLEQVRLTMPISVRRGDDPIGGNRITLARFGLPADIEEVDDLMRTVHSHVEQWRHEPAIPWSNAVAAVFNRLPSGAFAEMLKHVDFVASDVPGSPVPLYLAGAEVERIHAFGPTLGTAFNATLISHMGSCCIGLNIDTAAIPDLPVFAKCLDTGFDRVLNSGPESSGSR